MPIYEPKSLTDCQRFFLEPSTPKQRQYEALRMYFVERKSSSDVAHAFGYTPGSFRVMCHAFRANADPEFFQPTQRGPRAQPKKTRAADRAVELRKRNYSICEISAALKEMGIDLSAKAVDEILKSEGFAPLPRRLDEEIPERVRADTEAVADVRRFSTDDRTFTTRCGGAFLFLRDLARFDLDRMIRAAGLPGSKMIPARSALLSCLVLKLWGIERRSHVMSLVSDDGLAFFSGLNVTPKKSFLCEYSSRVDPRRTVGLLQAWHHEIADDRLFQGETFNLDFHSVPYHGTDETIERHYVPRRSRRQPSILVFLAQDAEEQAFCFSDCDIRKGEEADAVFRFVDFWERTRGSLPKRLIFDSRLTTYENLGRLDDRGILFLTLRRRSPSILKEVRELPPGAWRRVELDVPSRKYRTPRVYEKAVVLEGHRYRQIYILDLGHEEPTILLTNEPASTRHAQLITRYARRMLIENAISDAIRFFHMDALSSTVGLRVDFDMALLVVASGLYRLLAHRMRGYDEAQARHIFRDLVDIPADIIVSGGEVDVRFHRNTHLPILRASGLLDDPITVPWWNGLRLKLSGG